MAENEEGFSIVGNSLARIGRVVREVETNSGIKPPEHRRKRGTPVILEGSFLGALAPTDDPNVPTTAQFQIKTAKRDTDGWSDEDSPSIIPVLNRTHSSWSEGDPGTVIELYPNKYYALGATGRVVTNVRFRIVSSDPTTFTGLAEVLAWDYGFTLEQVPGLIVGTVIEICDPRACYLNEPNVDLTGRQGSAVYRQSEREDICRTGYQPFPGVWEVETMCCNLISCDVVI